MTFKQIQDETIYLLKEAKLGETISDTNLQTYVKSWINRRQQVICQQYNFYFMENIEADILTVDGQQTYSFAPIALTGTVAVSGTTVTGTGTLFATELKIGNSIKIETEVFYVASITDNTHLTLSSAGTTVSGKTAYKNTTFKDINRLGVVVGTEIKELSRNINLETSKYFVTGQTKDRPTEFWLENLTLYLYRTPNAIYTLRPRTYCLLIGLSADNDTNEITDRFAQILIDGACADGMYWLREDGTLREQKFMAGVQDMIIFDRKRKRLPIDATVTD